MRSVSSNVMLPELPDAKMETRKPIRTPRKNKPQASRPDCNGDILPRQTMEKYDLIVVGSGPAGQRAAIQAAKFGKRAALIEKLEVIGGTAINTGTIPSKTIREAVLHLSGYQYQSIYGLNYRVKEPITMADLSFRALNVIKTEIDVIRAQLSRNGIEVITGIASFADPRAPHASDELTRAIGV